MPEVFAVVGSFLSVAAALVSFFVSLNVRKRTLELKRVLSSKYQDLPLSPDVEDPDGSQVPAVVLDADERDR